MNKTRCMSCHGTGRIQSVNCPICGGAKTFTKQAPPIPDRVLNVLVGCEYSGVVRDAFIERGHNAISCDLLPTEAPGPHMQCDLREALECGITWDIMIAHPPCTHLSVSGAAWFWYKQKYGWQEEALDFVRFLMSVPVERICIENPVSIISTHIRYPDQIVNPFEYGHPVSKATCLWLHNLPKLTPTAILPFYQGIQRVAHTAHDKSRTFTGIARAMAQQWSYDYGQK